MITLEHMIRAVKAGPFDGSSDYDLNPAIKAALPDRDLRPASVLIPLIERRDGWRVILTKRASHLKHHPGQVSFPGGKVEAGETVEAAALREAEEEIGLPVASVDMIGALDLHVTVTNFRVTPFVGVTSDFTPMPEAGEVAEVFEVPLDFLMAAENMHIQGRRWQGQQRQYYTVPYGPYYIWGATARMIKALADRVAACA